MRKNSRRQGEIQKAEHNLQNIEKEAQAVVTRNNKSKGRRNLISPTRKRSQGMAVQEAYENQDYITGRREKGEREHQKKPTTWGAMFVTEQRHSVCLEEKISGKKQKQKGGTATQKKARRPNRGEEVRQGEDLVRMVAPKN